MGVGGGGKPKVKHRSSRENNSQYFKCKCQIALPMSLEEEVIYGERVWEGSTAVLLEALISLASQNLKRYP